jgi:hypothetical protein
MRPTRLDFRMGQLVSEMLSDPPAILAYNDESPLRFRGSRKFHAMPVAGTGSVRRVERTVIEDGD